MSLETTIANLVAAANNLTSAVNGKIIQIDQKVAAATEAVPAAISASLAKSVFVDGAAGNDANVGTQAQPFKTIRAACIANRQVQTLTIQLRRGQTHTDLDDGVSIVMPFDIVFQQYGPESTVAVIDVSKTATSNGVPWIFARAISFAGAGADNSIAIKTGSAGKTMPLFFGNMNFVQCNIDLREGHLVTTFEGVRHISVKLHTTKLTFSGAGFVVAGFNTYNGSFSFIPWAVTVTGDTLANRIGPIIRHAASNAPMNVLSNMSL